jgi:hypothetical protein
MYLIGINKAIKKILIEALAKTIKLISGSLFPHSELAV